MSVDRRDAMKREQENQLAASDLLESVVTTYQDDFITFYELKEALHQRGFGVLLMFFSLPLTIPVPVPPGLTTLFAIPLLLFSTQMILGFNAPWIPAWLGNRKLKRSTIAKIVEGTAPYLRRAEKLLRVRFSFLASGFFEKAMGSFCFILSSSIALPLPLTNFIPAIGVSLISLGIISRDGVVMLLGIVIGSIGLCITTLILYYGAGIIYKLIDILF